MPLPIIPSLPLSKRFSGLQGPFAGLSILLWPVAAQTSGWAREHAYTELTNVASGYWMGFGTAFAGWMFVHMWNGNGSRFVASNGFGRWISIISAGVVFLFGLAGFFIDLYGDTNGWFNTAFWVAAALVGVCVAPVIDAADGL